MLTKCMNKEKIIKYTVLTQIGKMTKKKVFLSIKTKYFLARKSQQGKHVGILKLNTDDIEQSW